MVTFYSTTTGDVLQSANTTQQANGDIDVALPEFSGSIAFQIHPVDATPPQIVSITNDVELDCSGPDGEEVTLSVEATDDIDKELSIRWEIELADGVVELIGTGAEITHTFGLGNHVVRVTVTDDAGNETVATVLVSISDTVAPVLHAALTAVGTWSDRNGDDDDNHHDRKRRKPAFLVSLEAEDACDPDPHITAFILQPIAPGQAYDVVYKEYRRRNDIQIRKKRNGKIKVRIRAADKAGQRALRALLEDAIALGLEDVLVQEGLTGGFPVEDGWALDLKTKLKRLPVHYAGKKTVGSADDDDDDGDDGEEDDHPRRPRIGTWLFRFDSEGILTAGSGPTLRMVAYATDESGNHSDVKEVIPAHPFHYLTKPVAAAAQLEDSDLGDTQLSLDQNYPNPANPATTIRYSLAAASEVRLTVYNVLGHQVKVLVRDHQDPGRYVVRWDGRDELGRHVSSGTYLYRLRSGRNVAVGRMQFVK